MTNSRKTRVNISHCLYSFLVGQKEYLLLIQRSNPQRDSQEPKTKQKIQLSQGLFSQFCTFCCKNPGFDGPWDMLQVLFLTAIFITLQQNAFDQKNKILCTGSKLPFWQFFIFSKMFGRQNERKLPCWQEEQLACLFPYLWPILCC